MAIEIEEIETTALEVRANAGSQLLPLTALPDHAKLAI